MRRSAEGSRNRVAYVLLVIVLTVVVGAALVEFWG
jgi:hypothetical protein